MSMNERTDRTALKRERPSRTSISFLLNAEEVCPKRAKVDPVTTFALNSSDYLACATLLAIKGDRRQLSSCTNISEDVDPPKANNSLPQPTSVGVDESMSTIQSEELKQVGLAQMEGITHANDDTPDTTTPSHGSTILEITQDDTERESAASNTAVIPYTQVPALTTLITNSASCDECGMRMGNEEAVLRHKRSKHASAKRKAKPIQCPVCKMTLKSAQNLTRHAKLHAAGAAYVCPECEVRFTTARSRTTHMRDAHGKSVVARNLCMNSVMCTFEGCYYSSNQSTNVKRHYESVHLKLRKFPCTICNFRSTTRSNLQAHMNTHGSGERK